MMSKRQGHDAMIACAILYKRQGHHGRIPLPFDTYPTKLLFFIDWDTMVRVGGASGGGVAASRGRQKIGSRMTQLVGLFLGAMLVFALGLVTLSWLHLTGLECMSSQPGATITSMSSVMNAVQDSSSSLRGLQQNQQHESQSSATTPGWKEIHVFYHDRDAGLNLTGDVESDPKWFSQVHQDEIVVDLLGRNGYFIDLAANDAREFSNTLALERSYGWTGLCIEPNPVYWYGLSHRKCTVVGALVGGDIERMEVKFRGVFGGIVGKMKDTLADQKNEPDAPVEQRFTTPLKPLFEQFHVPTTIDYMSLDVEGAERYIMEQFPFDKYTIKLMTIERPTRPLVKILNQHGYHLLKYLHEWGETLWTHNSTEWSRDHPDIVRIVEMTNPPRRNNKKKAQN